MGVMLFGGAAGSALPLALALCASLLAVAAADKYSAPTLDDNYASRNDYDDRGMQTLYNIARKILRGVQKSEPFPEGLFVVEGGEIKVHWDGPGNVVSYYAGVVAMVVLGLVVAVALPCAGFLWCLCGSGCKCSSGKAHKSGVRIQPHHPEAHDVELSREERHEPGPCFVPAALGVTACVIAAGACLVFATNAYMDRGIIGFPDHIIRGTNDVALFAQNSVLEVNTFFDKNYGELSLALSGILDDCQNSINDIVSSISNALPIDTLNALPDGLAAISEDLIELQKDGIAVVSSSAEIVRVVTQVKESISKKCTSDPCTSFVASLVTTAFPTLPDVSSSINTLQPFVDPSFKQSLQKGVKQLNDLEDQVKKTVDDTRKSIESSVKSAHTELQKTSKELIEKVDSVQSSIDDINKKVNETSDDLEHYESYKNGGFVVIGLVYLLIAVALAFGLVYGCCSKKNSYSILKLPVWFIFLTTCVLMLFTVVAFLAGLVGDRICEAVKDPEHNQVINLFDEMISKNRGDIVPGNISYYIKSCQRDETIYKVLQLDSTVNVDEILDIVDKFSFDQFLNQIDIEQGRIIKADLIPPEIKRNVEELENSDLATLDLTDIQTKIDEGNMIAGKVNLNEWVAGLETLETLETGLDVKDEIKSLEGLQQEVETLQTGANSLTSLIEKLQRDSRLGGNSFKEALSSFVTKIQKANDFIKSKVDFVPVANKTATEFKNEVTDYLKYVVGRVKNDALRCGPLHRVFNSIVVASCDEVLSPWNGFWAASGLCLLFFIPAAILAINLSSERR